MADRDVAAHERRLVTVAVDHGGVLHVAAVADLDAFVVGAQHGVEPDAGAIAQVHVADQLRARGHVKIVARGDQPLAFEFKNHAASPSGSNRRAASMHHARLQRHLRERCKRALPGPLAMMVSQ